jgi:hypothetical protein
MDGKSEVAKIEVDSQAPATLNVVALAVEKGADVATIEKMMELQERHEKNEARKAYVVAMTAFKADPPKIEKDKNVNFRSQKTGQVTDYNHATLANVTATINGALSKHGLSAAWKQGQSESGISVTCYITHILGHSESTTLKAGADNSGGKNSIQALGSTVTYLQRYTLLALTGLATHEADDDGKGAEAEYISEDQIEKLNIAIEGKRIDLGMFLDYMGAESLDKILVSDIKKAEHAIKLAKGKK